MSIESLSAWLVSLLQNRGLDRADGRLLFAYDLSPSEYADLGRLLTDTIAIAGGMDALATRCLGRPPIIGPPAAFVLFASEWWKREYGGGVWDWSPIVVRLKADPDAFPQLLRSHFVVRGLAFWQLTPLDNGRRFIGSIVVNGGIPLRLLSQGAGPVTTVLSQVLKLGARYHWTRAQMFGAMEERQSHLPAAYRRPEISDLLAGFVEAVLQLKEQYQLQGLNDPITRLDSVLPDWRRRFPVSLESEAAQALLTGLIREAASQRPAAARALFQVERRLTKPEINGDFIIQSHLSHPSSVPADALAGLFGLADAESLPRYFSIDLETSERQSFVDGRVRLGTQESTASLSGRKLVVSGLAAVAEHVLVLRSQQGSQSERITVPGGSALPDEDPWVFAEGDAGHLHFVAAGGARVPHESAWVALPEAWFIDTDLERPAEFLGDLVISGVPLRRIFRLHADAWLVLGELRFRVRLGQVAQTGQIYQWKGQRLPEAQGRSVFRDRSAPRLYCTDDDQLVQVPMSGQQWIRLGGQETVSPREARGPIEVRILGDGDLLTRQRIFVLPPEARIEYVSHTSVVTGEIRLINWGSVDIGVEQRTTFSANVAKAGFDTQIIQLSCIEEPPSEIKIHVRWTGSSAELPLRLPFPVTGGRFIGADGAVLRAGKQITLRDLIGLHLQVFDTNPSHPKRYEMRLALGSGAGAETIRIPIALDSNGRADVRLLEQRRNIESMLGLFDDLDAKVRVGLLVGGQCSLEIMVARYGTLLETGAQMVCLPLKSLAALSVEVLAQARAVASVMVGNKAHTVELEPVLSEGVRTGGWSTQPLNPALAPWLIYPSEDSSVQFRPLVWSEAPDPEGISEGAPPADTAAPANALALAIAIQSRTQRCDALHSVLATMAEDLSHPSWPLLEGLWQTFHHLPLTTLDVWRMLANQPRAVLAFLLRAELSDAEMAEALHRFRDETGWMPELTTVEDLNTVARTLWLRWAAQLPPELCKTVFTSTLEGRFRLLGSEIPTLEPLLDMVLFAATGTLAPWLLEVAGPTKISTRNQLNLLWQGADSLVNAQLFLVNADRDFWPGRDFFKAMALPAFDRACTPESKQKLTPYFVALFWPRMDDFKCTVANLPMLCAIWAATSTSSSWWSDHHCRLLLKRVRDFDPIWFEQAFRQACKVLMSIDGLIPLKNITGPRA